MRHTNDRRDGSGWIKESMRGRRFAATAEQAESDDRKRVDVN